MACVGLLATSVVLGGAGSAAAAATPTISPAQATPGNGRSLTWNVTAGDTADTLDCRLDGPDGVVVDWVACGPTFNGTISPTGTNGDYVATVRETAVDLTTQTASDTYVLDTQAPGDPTFTAEPTTPSANGAVSWSWTVPEGSAECSLTGPADGFGWTACPSGSYGTTLTSGGSYQFSVRTVDTAGNRSSGISSPFVLDLTGPNVTVTVTPSTSNGSPTPQASFAIGATDTASCEVRQAGVALVGPVGCTSPWSIPVSGLADGSYDVVVTATDNLGNTGTPGSASLTLDRSAPSDVPVITSTPGAAGNDPTPSWSFTVASGETAQCMFESPTQVLTSWMACSSPVTTASLLGRAETTYTLSIRAVDSAGNTGSPVSSSYRYDVTAPGTPAVTLSAAAGSTTVVTASWPSAAVAPETQTATCRVLRSDLTVVSATSCSSPATLSVPAVEGTYTIEVQLTDDAGNIGPASSNAYTYDVTAPGAPGVSGPTSGNSTAPTFTITATESNETFLCTWSLQGNPLATVACGPGAWVTTTVLTGDGPWTLVVIGRDAAGNLSSGTSRSYLLDTGPPPAPVITLVGTSPGNDVTPTWTFTAEAQATTECRLTTGTTVVSPWGACPGGTITYDLTPATPTTVPDGAYTLSVRARDVAGNVGAVASSVYQLDTQAPGAAVFFVQPTGPSRFLPTWSFSTVGASAECELVYAGTAVSTWTPCSSPWVGAVSADGDYALSVRTVDSAGNIGPTVTSVGFVYDTTGPAAPVLTQQPASPSPNTAPVVGFTVGSGESAECRVRHHGATVIDWTSCTSPWTVDLTGQPDRDYVLEVRAVDSAGNPGQPVSVDYTLDSTAPATANFTSVPASPSRSRTPSFGFDVTDGTTAECQVTSATEVLADWAACSSPYALVLTTEPDGSYSLGVRLVDAAGNRSAVTVASYALDTTPPAAPVFGALPASPTSAAVSDWRWSGEEGALAFCSLRNGARVVLGWRACTSPYRVNLAGQPDGTYTLLVRLTDQAGNTGPARAAALVLDTTPPTPVFIRTPSSPSTDRTPRWSWTVEAGTAVSCLLTRGAVVVADWTPCAGSYTADLADQPDGTYRLSLRAVDRTGNMGAVVSNEMLLRSGALPPPAGGSTTPPPVRGPVSGPGRPVGSGPNVVTPRPVPTTPRPIPSSTPAPSVVVPSGGSIVKPDPINRVPELLGRAAVRSLDKPQIPVILLVLVFLFLLVQNRIDRRDPKLAQAPVGVEPLLTFGRLSVNP